MTLLSHPPCPLLPLPLRPHAGGGRRKGGRGVLALTRARRLLLIAHKGTEAQRLGDCETAYSVMRRSARRLIESARRLKPQAPGAKPACAVWTGRDRMNGATITRPRAGQPAPQRLAGPQRGLPPATPVRSAPPGLTGPQRGLPPAAACRSAARASARSAIGADSHGFDGFPIDSVCAENNPSRSASIRSHLRPIAHAAI